MEAFAVPGSEKAKGCFTQPQRLLQYRVEHGCEIAGGRIDDLQYLGGRGLLLQRLVSLGFALGKFSLTLGKLTLQIGYQLLCLG